MTKHHRRNSSQESFYLHGLQLLSIAPEEEDNTSDNDGIPASIQSFDLSSEEEDYVYSDDDISLQDQIDEVEVLMEQEIKDCIEANNRRTDASAIPDVERILRLVKKRRLAAVTKEENDDLLKLLLADKFRRNDSFKFCNDDAKKRNQTNQPACHIVWDM